jgi:hypothetical protein
MTWQDAGKKKIRIVFSMQVYERERKYNRVRIPDVKIVFYIL